MRAFLLACLFSTAMLVPGTAVIAHGGGLNAEGCHNDRKNGGYHCHRGSSSSGSSKRSYGLASSHGASFANCSAARAAGAAPVRAGDPAYSRKLDRDGDGVGCE